MKRLSPRHIRALDLLMVGQTQRQVASTLGVHKRTVQKWMAHPLFQRAWQDRRDELMTAGADRAKSAAALIHRTLIEAMSTGGPQQKITAAWYMHRILVELDGMMAKEADNEYALSIPLDRGLIQLLLAEFGSRETAAQQFADMIKAAADADGGD